MSQATHTENSLEQLHLSATVLVFKLALLLFMLDAAFLLLLLGFLALSNYPDAHHHYTLLLVAVQIVKYVVLTIVTLQLVAKWSSRNIYVSNQHLVIASGVTNKKQKVYDLEQLLTIELQQDWVGQQLNFGSIHLTFAASGFKQEVVLTEISHPEVCSKLFQKYLGAQKAGV